MGSTAIIDSLSEVKKKLNQDSMVRLSAKKLEMTKDYRWMGLNTPLLYYLISHLSILIKERGPSDTRAFSKHKITKPAQKVGETRHSPLASQAFQENLSGCSDDPNQSQQAGRADIGGNLNPFGLEGRVRRTEIDLRLGSVEFHLSNLRSNLAK
uniref:Uncharacterized protein n=1 Tax=Solanum lycopersicum TaxID=4081 RepID=K4D7R4_SOLLC